MSEQHVPDCVVQPPFPLCPDNRPGLSWIKYRIGDYGQIRASLMAALNKDDILQPWTHRGSDDPGIALLEGAAILGDILTFYQETYANEAFLRTARWRESVSDLVRLLGYRMAPGVGGRGVFAFEIRGDAAIKVLAGFPITAQVTGLAGPSDFQTSADMVAYPWLSRFALYRPVYVPPISASTTELTIATSDGSTLALQAGDKLMLGEAGADGALGNPEIVIIDSVRQRHGQSLYKIKGALQRTSPVAALTGYKIGRTFHHFGNNSPPFQIDLSRTPPSPVRVFYSRRLGETTTASDPALAAEEMALDARVDNLPLGSTLICQYTSSVPYLINTSPPLTTKTRTISSIRQGSYTWGAITGQSTVLSLDHALEGSSGGVISLPVPVSTIGFSTSPVSSPIQAFSLSAPGFAPMTGSINHWIGGDDLSDIRQMLFHETLSPALQVQACPEAEAASHGTALGFVGTEAEAQTLTARSLLLLRPGKEPQSVVVQSVTSLSGVPAGQRLMHRIEIDKDVEYADFPLEESPATVFGNLVDATQGKQERDAALGSGDSRQLFQTFKLPKSPLTYLTLPGETPPETPELEVYVAGRKWQRVASFFNYRAKDQVFIVREDAAGDSWVQFGDGKTGARLPSGLSNVVARYRSGVAAYGPLQDGTTAQAGTRLDKLDKIQMPGVISGGEGPEPADSARVAAPGRVQSLGRLVSLADFATEALAIAGVSRASAAWQLQENLPSVVLTVLMDAGRESEIESVRSIMALANRERGPARFPVLVNPGRRLYFYVSLNLTYDSTYRPEDVEAAVRHALGSAGRADDADGTSGRGFGERVYATQIEGIVQNVPGVLSAHVSRLGTRWLAPPLQLRPLLALRLIALPLLLQRHEVLTAGPDAILALSDDDLQISLASQVVS